MSRSRAAQLLGGATAWRRRLARPGRRCARRLWAVAVLLSLGAVTARELALEPGDSLPPLSPGDSLSLAPGVYQGPWLIDVQGVSVEAEEAILMGTGDGSVLVLSAPDIAVRGLEIAGSGRTSDLYAPDAAVVLDGCHGCSLAGLISRSAPTAVRVEASESVSVTDSELQGDGSSPGLTSYASPRLTFARNRVETFLDGIYLERTDGASVAGNTFLRTTRYALHVMYSVDTSLTGNLVRGGLVGSAAMYGRGLNARGNRFEGHVGPLAFGLLVHELRESVVSGNSFDGNTVGLLIASAPDVTVADNLVTGSGFGIVVQRVPRSQASAVRISGNIFSGNVADVAVDDPDAAVSLVGNQYESASRLDRDHDGVADVAHVPSSSFDVFASRNSDLSLYALNPGVLLWQAAEASVPALRLASLADPEPRLDLATVALVDVAASASGPAGVEASAAGALAAGSVLLVTILVAAAAAGPSHRRPVREGRAA